MDARLATEARTAGFFFAAWLGAGFLAVDEIVGAHENLGHNLRFLADLPGIERPDDAVLALYTLPVLGFLFAFRRIILGSRAARIFFGLGAAIFLVAAAADVLDIGRDEELIEILASFTLLLGFMILSVEELRRVAARSTDPLSSGRTRRRTTP